MFQRIALKTTTARHDGEDYPITATDIADFDAAQARKKAREQKSGVSKARLITEAELREIGRKAAQDAGFDSAEAYLADIVQKQNEAEAQREATREFNISLRKALGQETAEFSAPSDAPEYLANELFHAPTTEAPPSPQRKMRTLTDDDTTGDPDLMDNDTTSDPDLTLD